jgi:transcriptional regulator with XRE-family HTH domain
MKPPDQPVAPQAFEPLATHTAAPVKAPPTLGSVVRGLRQRNDWTLKEMSQHTGIPLSTLAKVEHDRLTLTYDKLQQLSRRLQIPMSSLFAEPSEQTETRVSGRRSIGRLGQFVRVDTAHYEYGYLCTELRRKRMIPVLGVARAKTVEEFGPLAKHAGEEFIFVLKGSVAVHTEFYDPVVLEVGECIYLDSDMGHAYLAGPGCAEASFLAVCSSAEEGFMETLLGVHKKGVAAAVAAQPTSPAAGANSPKARRRKKR